MMLFLKNARSIVSKTGAINPIKICRHSSFISRDQMMLHQSPIPTDYFQDKLPRLPIPALDDSCERYLEAMKPLVSQEQWHNTEHIVRNFQKSSGIGLQERLVKWDSENLDKTMISDAWFDMYIAAREPLVLNFNAFINFARFPSGLEAYNKQAVKATNLTISMIKFMATYEDGKLIPNCLPARANPYNKHLIQEMPAEVFGKPMPVLPLDMSQFKHLFKSTRIPRQGRDELKTYPESRHVTVQRRGHFYKVQVLQENGDLISPESILSSFEEILADTRPPAECPIGPMTSENRDVWAATREKLVQAGNSSALDDIDGAIFPVIFDDDEYSNNDALFRSFLHGDPRNRWYEKSFQVLVPPGEETGIMMEHSWGDGLTCVYAVTEAWKDAIKNPAVNPTTTGGTSNVQKIDFAVTQEIQADVSLALQRFEENISGLDLKYTDYQHFGSNLMKTRKISPDSVIQLAYQVAFYKEYGFHPPTYESCSTAIFRLGRTETVRPATVETQRVCQMLCSDSKPSNEELLEAMRQCSNKHGRLAMEASVGQGFDRHFMGLRLQAMRDGGDMPEIFTDATYAGCNNYILSTSTVGGQEGLGTGGFAPVVLDGGLGIGYGVGKDNMIVMATGYQPRDLGSFRSTLVNTLDTIRDVLEGRPLS